MYLKHGSSYFKTCMHRNIQETLSTTISHNQGVPINFTSATEEMIHKSQLVTEKKSMS